MFDFLQAIFQKTATFFLASVISVASFLTSTPTTTPPFQELIVAQQEDIQHEEDNKKQIEEVEDSSPEESKQNVVESNKKMKRLGSELRQEKDRNLELERLRAQVQLLQQQQSLREAQEQQEILTPHIASVNPTALPFDDLFTMMIYGSNFQDNAEVLVNDHSLGRFKLQDSGNLQKEVRIQGDSPNIPYWISSALRWKIEVINPNGKSDIKEDIFSIDKFPHRFSDKTPPRVHLERWGNSIVHSFVENDWCKNGGKICGTLGLWTYNFYDDISPSSGIGKIEFYVDNNFFSSVVSFNSKIAWDTTQLPNGEHTLIAKVYDRAGNMGEGSVVIEIEN